MNLRHAVELFCRWLAGALFIYASIHKILNPCEFALDVYHYRLLPGMVVNLVAIVVPFVEIVFGIGLITGLGARGAALGLLGLLLVFITILSINFVKGLSFDCGCFSSERDWCELFQDWVVKKFPGLSPQARARCRTGCDIFRDLVIAVPVFLAYVLMNRRLRNTETRG